MNTSQKRRKALESTPRTTDLETYQVSATRKSLAVVLLVRNNSRMSNRDAYRVAWKRRAPNRGQLGSLAKGPATPALPSVLDLYRIPSGICRRPRSRESNLDSQDEARSAMNPPRGLATFSSPRRGDSSFHAVPFTQTLKSSLRFANGLKNIGSRGREYHGVVVGDAVAWSL